MKIIQSFLKKSQIVNTEEDARSVAPLYDLYYNGKMESGDRILFMFTTNNGKGTTFSLRPGGNILDKIKNK